MNAQFGYPGQKTGLGLGFFVSFGVGFLLLEELWDLASALKSA